MIYLLLASLIVIALLILIPIQRGTLVWTRLQEDLAADDNDRSRALALQSTAPTQGGPLAVWLYRAGFRSPSAPLVFLTVTAICILLAASVVFMLYRSGSMALTADALYSIPGGVGNVMVPFALATPWFLLVVISLIPLLIVRSVRRQRVVAIQQDLPLLLDLLNTLAGAGIGFDEALQRILASQPEKRPLVQEFRSFQVDTLAGRSRIASLKRLMSRVHVPMFSSFISALIQAEQSGAGMSATMATQAIEIRNRRRELAQAAAMAVPTKLVLPMVIGFLPGIFVVLLGPMVMEAFAVMGQSFRGVAGP